MASKATKIILTSINPENFSLVERLIKKAHPLYDMAYQRYLANHLSHGLYSLCGLGASKERLEEFYEHYVKRLEPMPDSKYVIDREHWTQRIDDTKAYPEFCQFFMQEAEQLGVKRTLNEYFPKLMGYSAGEALHPLIYVGYAMEYQNPIVLAEGLSYCCTFPLMAMDKLLPLTEAPTEVDNQSSKSASVLELLDEIRLKGFPPKTIGTDFHDNMSDWLEKYDEDIANLLKRWTISPDEINQKLIELTEACFLGALCTYANEIDFFLLHGATANHAVRVILPHLDKPEDKIRLMKINLIVLFVVYALQGSPKPDIAFVNNYLDTIGKSWSWEEIIETATSRNEEHVPKLVRSLIYYAENNSEDERSSIFTNDFVKKCASKAIGVLRDIDDFRF